MNAQNLLNAFQNIDSDLIADAEEQRISRQNKRDKKNIFQRVTAGLTAVAACCGIVWAVSRNQSNGLTTINKPSNSELSTEYEKVGSHLFEVKEALAHYNNWEFYCYDEPVDKLRDVFVDMMTQTEFKAVRQLHGGMDNYTDETVWLRFTPMTLNVNCNGEPVSIQDFNTVLIPLDTYDHVDLICGAETNILRLEYDENSEYASTLTEAAKAAEYAGYLELHWGNIPEEEQSEDIPDYQILNVQYQLDSDWCMDSDSLKFRDQTEQLLNGRLETAFQHGSFERITEQRIHLSNGEDFISELSNRSIILTFEPMEIKLKHRIQYDQHERITVEDVSSVMIPLEERDKLYIVCGDGKMIWQLCEYCYSKNLHIEARKIADALLEQYYDAVFPEINASAAEHLEFANDYFAANHDIADYGFRPEKRTLGVVPLFCGQNAKNAETNLPRVKRYFKALCVQNWTASEKPLDIRDAERCCTELRFDAPQEMVLGGMHLSDVAALWVKPSDSMETVYSMSADRAAACRYDVYILHSNDLTRENGTLTECFTMADDVSGALIYHTFMEMLYPMK